MVTLPGLGYTGTRVCRGACCALGWQPSTDLHGWGVSKSSENILAKAAALLHGAVADEDMRCLLTFSQQTVIDSIVEDQYLAPRPQVAEAAPVGVLGARAGSPLRRRHKRSNTYPDANGAAVGLAAPYPTTDLQLRTAHWAEQLEQEHVASATGTGAASALGCNTSLSSPATGVAYPDAATHAQQTSVPRQPDPHAGSQQQQVWQFNPAFRASWDLDEKLSGPGQSEEPAQLSSGGQQQDSATGPELHAAPSVHEDCRLKVKPRSTSASSSIGSPLIASAFNDGAPLAAQGAPAATETAPSLSAGDAAATKNAAASSARTSSSGSTLAQRRSINIPPLESAGPSRNARRQELWQSTLSPVHLGPHDASATMLISAASAAAAFGRRSSMGTAFAPSSNGAGVHAMAPASRISAFGLQLLSLSQNRLRVSQTGDSVSADASADDSDTSGGDGDDVPLSPDAAQAVMLQRSSFRRRPGPAVRQIAQSVRRMGGKCCSRHLSFVFLASA